MDFSFHAELGLCVGMIFNAENSNSNCEIHLQQKKKKKKVPNHSNPSGSVRTENMCNSFTQCQTCRAEHSLLLNCLDDI